MQPFRFGPRRFPAHPQSETRNAAGKPYRCINIAYLGISGSLQGFEVMKQLLLD